jgi:hypothetical protein
MYKIIIGRELLIKIKESLIIQIILCIGDEISMGIADFLGY